MSKTRPLLADEEAGKHAVVAKKQNERIVCGKLARRAFATNPLEIGFTSELGFKVPKPRNTRPEKDLSATP